MSIFDLQNIAEKRVASHGPHKVLLCSLILFKIRIIKLEIGFKRISVNPNADSSAFRTRSRGSKITYSQLRIMLIDNSWTVPNEIGRVISYHTIIIVRVFFISKCLNKILS